MMIGILALVHETERVPIESEKVRDPQSETNMHPTLFVFLSLADLARAALCIRRPLS
jgi:hypothetical protein